MIRVQPNEGARVVPFLLFSAISLRLTCFSRPHPAPLHAPACPCMPLQPLSPINFIALPCETIISCLSLLLCTWCSIPLSQNNENKAGSTAGIGRCVAAPLKHHSTKRVPRSSTQTQPTLSDRPSCYSTLAAPLVSLRSCPGRLLPVGRTNYASPPATAVPPTPADGSD